jgi:hypothetical protein
MKMPAGQIERIKGLGYTEAEAHFLYIVAIHSGANTSGEVVTNPHRLGFTHGCRVVWSRFYTKIAGQLPISPTSHHGSLSPPTADISL